MKKLIISAVSAALLFAALSIASANPSVKNSTVDSEKNYEVGEIVSTSDALYKPEQVAGFDSEKNMKWAKLYLNHIQMLSQTAQSLQMVSICIKTKQLQRGIRAPAVYQ